MPGLHTLRCGERRGPGNAKRGRLSISVIAALAVIVVGCGHAGPQVTRVQARPMAPTLTIGAGEHPLGMATVRLRDLAKRDGRLYVPKQAAPQRPLPLIVLLHGGGGRAEDFKSMFPLAEEFGVVLLALDSRHNTWDGIDSPFGPDVQFIDAALRYTFERVAIDPAKNRHWRAVGRGRLCAVDRAGER